MKIKALSILFILSLIVLSCSKDNSSGNSSNTGYDNSRAANTGCQNDQSLRRGEMCKDGTNSNATGSGACSHHDGVDYWLC